MGSFHDQCQGGKGRGVLVTRVLSGTGKGAVDINVVKGRVDLRAWN